MNSLFLQWAHLDNQVHIISFFRVQWCIFSFALTAPYIVLHIYVYMLLNHYIYASYGFIDCWTTTMRLTFVYLFPCANELFFLMWLHASYISHLPCEWCMLSYDLCDIWMFMPPNMLQLFLFQSTHLPTWCKPKRSVFWKVDLRCFLYKI